MPASTAEKAGVQTAADKKLFDSIPADLITWIDESATAEKVTIIGQVHSIVDGEYTMVNSVEKDIAAASQTVAGVMTAADKVKLDVTLPNAIAKETQDRIDAIEALGEESEAALAKEIADRRAADTALDTKFTKAVSDEATARTSADTALGARIDKEITDRTAADTALDNKLQNNINTLEAKHDAFVATKGKANGFASLDANGTVPASQLPSYVDDIIEVYATYTVGVTGGLTNIQLYSDAAHTRPITGESGKIYVNIASGEPSYQFRWSGTAFVDSNTSSLIIGQIAGTAFDGARGKELERQMSSLKANGASHLITTLIKLHQFD